MSSPGLLDEIAAVLDVALSGRGFGHGERADAGDAIIRRWVRDSTWKRDTVNVVYRRGRTHLTIGLSVEVPAAGRHVNIDGTNAGYLSGRPGDYPLPRGWFRAWKRRRFLDRIDRDVRAAVDWFDDYDSPRQALKKLQSPERNGCRIDSDPHRAVVAFLENLGDAHPSRRELIDAFTSHVRSIFGPVAERHGLTLREVERRLFALESATVRVCVRFGSGHQPDVNVFVGPGSGRQPHYDDRSPDTFGLAFEPQSVTTAEDVRHALEAASRAVDGHFDSGP